jgi:hypothetical protein
MQEYCMKKLHVLFFSSLITTTAIHPMMFVKTLKSKQIKKIPKKFIHFMPAVLAQHKITHNDQVHQLAKKRNFCTKPKKISKVVCTWWEGKTWWEEERFKRNGYITALAFGGGAAMLACGGKLPIIMMFGTPDFGPVMSTLNDNWFFLAGAFSALNMSMKEENNFKKVLNIIPLVLHASVGICGGVELAVGFLYVNPQFFLPGIIKLAISIPCFKWHKYEILGEDYNDRE